MGVSDEWDGSTKVGDTAPWLDVELRVEGAMVGVLEGVFLQQWTDAGGVASLARCWPRAHGDGDAQGLVTAGDGPSFRSSPLRALFAVTMAAARRRIWLASPYVLPDRYARAVLRDAARRGIDVRILTTGPRCDIPLVYRNVSLDDPALAARVQDFFLGAIARSTCVSIEE